MAPSDRPFVAAPRPDAQAEAKRADGSPGTPVARGAKKPAAGGNAHPPKRAKLPAVLTSPKSTKPASPSTAAGADPANAAKAPAPAAAPNPAGAQKPPADAVDPAKAKPAFLLDPPGGQQVTPPANAPPKLTTVDMGVKAARFLKG